MQKRELKEGWNLYVCGENVFGIPEKAIETSVPSSVYSTLLDQGLMPDPFYRINELDALKLMDNDFRYETTITLSEEERSAERCILRFEGIDTLGDVFLDGVLLGSTKNMHRTWEFDITSFAKEKEELLLSVKLYSPVKYIREEQKKSYVRGSSDAMEGFPHLRKAHCMFGWDWGPRLPDAGLFRDVSILAVNKARISAVLLTQEHSISGKTVHGNLVSSVRLNARIEVDWTEPTAFDRSVYAELSVKTPDGEKTYQAESAVLSEGEDASGRLSGKAENHSLLTVAVDIDNPRLWWPNGYGDQPLYPLDVILRDKETGLELDRYSARAGLRTATVNTDPRPEEGFGAGQVFDEHMEGQKKDDIPGRNFAFEVNGLEIFAMGADYIPEDNLITRMNRERTARLLSDAVLSNMNCIRVWGGGFYPADYFFDLCDELGLLVWEDMMFACAAYDLTEEFEADIEIEVRENLRRIRNHPSIGVISGNNENETQIFDWARGCSRKLIFDYIRMYEHLFPRIVKEEAPDAFYWPSSPSSGGNFDHPMAENVGDVHYWGVWHGNEPFTAYRSHHYRFLSEFGFQSFPCQATVDAFTEKADQNIFSRVMEMHQRNAAANGKILNYLSATYLYPKNFGELLYTSQLLQADAIRYGVEHFRRFRGRCMGTVVWQLNDIWPVASWASIDYYGRWKALAYAEKRMFAPVMLSCEEKGEIDQKPNVNSEPREIELSASLHVANETGEPVSALVRWSLRNPDSSILKEGESKVTVPAYDGIWLDRLDFSDESSQDVHLLYELELKGEIVSSGTCLFCAPKHYHFRNPSLSVSSDGESITVRAENYARSVAVESQDGELLLDDNFVDLEKGERTFRILRGGPEEGELEMWLNQLTVRSVYGIAAD